MQLKINNGEKSTLTSPLIFIMSLAAGLAVASNYYAQPLLATIAEYFKLSENHAGLIVTTAQLSYAIGLLFIIPLGDIFEQRWLIVSMTFLSAIGLLITALSPSIIGVIIGTAVTGLFSVVAQLLVPLAAALANPEERGKIVGTLMSGLMLGILLARTFAGALAFIGDWRTIYYVSFILMISIAIALWRMLPRYQTTSKLSYFLLIKSIFQLFSEYKILRTRALLGALAFANFSVFWTAMAFLLASPPYNFSEMSIGIFALIGVAGAIGANFAGRFVDHGLAKQNTIFGFCFILLSWIPLWYGQYTLWALIIGTFTLDLFIPAIHITNQAKIYQSMPEARGRLTAGYMTCYFIGGAFGSAVSAYAYNHFSWNGIVFAGAILAIIGLIYAFIQRERLN